MRKAGLALCLFLLGLAPAQSQPVTQPAPVGAAGAYNTGTVTCTNPNFCFLQTDANGNLKVVASGTPSGTQAVSIASGQVASGAFAAGSMVDLLTMRGTVAAGTAAANSILGGIVYNSTVPALTTGQQVASQSDTTGSIQVNAEGRKATYSAAYGSFVVTATGTFIQLQGSASKTVRVNRIILSGTLTTGADCTASIYRTTTAASGGSPVTGAGSFGGIAKYDSSNATATAVPVAWTTSPSGTGTLAGGIADEKFFVPAATAAPTPVIFDFGIRNNQAVVLRGTSEFVSLFVTCTSFIGASFSGFLEWTEE